MPFNDISLARDVTNARTPLSDRIAKGNLSVAIFVVLYAQNAYDCMRVVIRLAYEVPMKTNPEIPHFKTMAMVDVPRSRNGKHKKIVAAILRDLDDLGEGAALKVPLAELGDSKENVRSALNRATRKSGRVVATSTDENFLYVWNVAKPERLDGTRPNGQGKLPRSTS